MKLRILHVIGNLSKGGAEHQMQLLLRSLDRERYELSVAYLYDGLNVSLPDYVHRIRIERGAKYDLFSLWKKISRKISGDNFDLIQVWLPEVIALPAAWIGRINGIPVITSQRTTMSWNRDWRKSYRNGVRYLQIMAAHRIVSNFDVDEEPFLFRRLFERKKGVVIPNGLDVRGLRALPPRQLSNRAEWRLVYVGRLSPEKRIELAFGALKMLIVQGVEVHLTLVGEGEPSYTRQLNDMVADFGIQRNVTFYGQCKEWTAFASDAHALVFPSRGEGMSNVVLEALAVGLPVIISDIAMARRLFRHKMDGFIVKSAEAAAWSDGIRTVLEQPEVRAKLAENGKRIASQFSVDIMVDSYTKLYSDICRNYLCEEFDKEHRQL